MRKWDGFTCFTFWFNACAAILNLAMLFAFHEPSSGVCALVNGFCAGIILGIEQ
jgi:hypothetical protein